MLLRHDAYDEQSAQKILLSAMERQADDNTASGAMRLVSAHELEAMAAELGVTRAHLLAAQEEWQREQLKRADEQQAWRVRRRWFRFHALVFFVVNGLSVPSLYFSDFFGYHPDAAFFPYLWVVAFIGHASVLWQGRGAIPTDSNGVPIGTAL